MKTKMIVVMVCILLAAFFMSACATKETIVNTAQQPVLQNAKEIEPSCPKGIINEPYPGTCVLYTDNNKNNICDLSE